MVKDKYLKESQIYQNLLKTAKKYGVADYVPGQSLEAHKEKMSAEDYETYQKLNQYYTGQQSLTDEYNQNSQSIEYNRKKQLQENAIAKELAMKYLPEHLKAQGMGGLGVASSTIIDANNNFRNTSNTINADANSQLSEMTKNYLEALRNYDNNANKDSADIVSKYQQEYFDNFKNKIDYGEFNTSEELEQSFNKIKDKLSESQKSILEDKVNFYKNNLEQKQIDLEYREKQDEVTKETKAQTEKDARVIEGKEFVSYGGKEYKLTTQLNSTSNEIAHNNSFKDKLKELGFSNPYDQNIPNGTTVEIKCDSYGKDEFDFVKDILGTGFNPVRNITNIWGGITGVDSGYTSFSRFKKTITYYNGDWYISEKQ